MTTADGRGGLIAARGPSDDRKGPPVLRVENVRRDYRMGQDIVRALRGVSFDVYAGEYIAIVGPSGCGKSTLLNLMGVIDRPTAGTVSFGGRDVGTLRDHDATAFRLHHIGFVFQRFYLMPTLSARENIELPLAEAGASPTERKARARELLAAVGLEKRERHRPAELSGGEQQRVAIARALANRPALLLADEPTGELDGQTGAQVIEVFRRLHNQGATIVVVTHDDGLAATAGRVIQMKDGQIAP